jgi:hypothetical protein
MIITCRPVDHQWYMTRQFPCDRGQLQLLCDRLEGPAKFYDTQILKCRNLELRMPGSLGFIQPVLDDGFLKLLYCDTEGACQDTLLRVITRARTDPASYRSEGPSVDVTDAYHNLKQPLLEKCIKDILLNIFDKFFRSRRFLVEGDAPPGSDGYDYFTLDLPYVEKDVDSLRKILLNKDAQDGGRAINLHRFAHLLPDKSSTITPTINGEFLVLQLRRFFSDTPKPIVWLKDSQNMWISQGCDPQMTKYIHKILCRALYIFVADEERRKNCIFCNHDLVHRGFGYGPDCAEKHRLCWLQPHQKPEPVRCPDEHRVLTLGNAKIMLSRK